LAFACDGCLSAEEYNSFLTLTLTEDDYDKTLEYEDVEGGEFADKTSAREAEEELQSFWEARQKK